MPASSVKPPQVYRKRQSRKDGWRKPSVVLEKTMICRLVWIVCGGDHETPRLGARGDTQMMKLEAHGVWSRESRD
jgi:hypothetical protein